MRRKFAIKNRLGLAVWYLVVFLLLAIAIMFAICLIGDLLTSGRFSETVTSGVVFDIVSIFLYLLPALYLLLAHHSRIQESRVFSLQNRGAVLAVALFIFVAYFIPSSFVDDLLALPDLGSGADLAQSSKNVYGALSISLVGPFAEEVLFRGAIERSLLKWKRNPWYAIIISAVLWGLVHVDPAQVVDASLCGIVYGWIYYRTRSIWPTVAMHIANNTACTVLSWFFGDPKMLQILGGSWPLYAVLALVSLALLVVSLRLFNRFTRRPQHPHIPLQHHAPAGTRSSEPQGQENGVGSSYPCLSSAF